MIHSLNGGFAVFSSKQSLGLKYAMIKLIYPNEPSTLPSQLSRQLLPIRLTNILNDVSLFSWNKMDKFENYKVKQFTQRKTVIMIVAFYHIYYKDKYFSIYVETSEISIKDQCATFSEKQEVITLTLMNQLRLMKKFRGQPKPWKERINAVMTG